ncbi:Mth938-like domain-containing protein [Ferruginivarius sediminum]|uniref:Xcc1710-like domain-containing protein n=1 Tax=Ferruginivarius sediminum TaxID=2661937 RepID=A0A369T7W9_9PROT|nr:Mth938-like domain-containing protein [Ferruginivarius sediminum]RDD61429.1 hypothetical protein DRB17_13205 [Ferruginivarius sediminum]
MDVTPQIAEGKQVIEAYGDKRFRVTGEVYEGSILVFPDRTLNWKVAAFEDLTVESLQPIIDAAGDVEVLLLGCGARMELVTKTVRGRVRDAGIVIEPMDTGAAARTYNVLMMEDRRVAAALIAV